MGMYLPTITISIPASDLPKKPLQHWKDVEALLVKYQNSEYFYQCTSKGYHHLECYRRMVEDFQLPKLNFFFEECAAITPQEVAIIYQNLLKVEDFILNSTHKIIANICNMEIKMWELFNKNKPYSTELKTRIETLEHIELSEVYESLPVLKDISQYDIDRKFKSDIADEYTLTLYWLKAQLFIFNNATKSNNAIVHTWISPT